MTVGLFIPCYIDQFYPRVGIASLELLERLGCDVVCPRDQTCCGQPMSNAGCERDAAGVHRHFADVFSAMDYVVAPSGSCVLHVREHVGGDVGARTFELCQFLVEVLDVKRIDASFPARVGLHAACHGLRGLRLGASSERRDEPFDHVRGLLNLVDGLELVELTRRDECCGFGGTFAVDEEAISVRMGRDRLDDHARHGADVITSTDMSCLMHLDGLIRSEGRPLRVLHVAEILNGVREGATT